MRRKQIARCESWTYIYNEFSKTFNPIVAISLTIQYYGSDCPEDFMLFLDIATNQAKSCINEKTLYMPMPASFEAKIICTENEGGNLSRMYYTPNGVLDVVSFDVFNVLQTNTQINRCALCGKAFLPLSRSDEMYCKNEYKNGRSCAEVAFELQSKSDPFYCLYRNAYRAESARTSRMFLTEKRRTKQTAWRKLAKEKLQEFQSANDIDGFKKWLLENKNS